MKKQAKPTSTVQTVGLDIGYGVTKAICGDNVVMFPSVMSHAREIKFNADQTAAKYAGDQIADDDGQWFIGDLALSQAKKGELIKLRGRTADEATIGNVFRVRLAKVALGKLFPDYHNGEAVHIRIATGLPVDHMGGAAALKAALIGQHPINTDTANFVANVTEVMVMPQPYGTIYANTLTSTGDLNPCHTAIKTGVIDVGTYTIDAALDDDGEYIDAESGSAESGVFTAQERIKEAVNRDYGFIPKQKFVEAVLKTACISVRGAAPVSYADEVERALAPLRDATLVLMNDKWSTGDEVDIIYVSGGGAELVFNDIKAAYPQAKLVENAQLANAIGYQNYARFAERE